MTGPRCALFRFKVSKTASGRPPPRLENVKLGPDRSEGGLGFFIFGQKLGSQRVAAPNLMLTRLDRAFGRAAVCLNARLQDDGQSIGLNRSCRQSIRPSADLYIPSRRRQATAAELVTGRDLDAALGASSFRGPTPK
jgi:hypothetical protein